MVVSNLVCPSNSLTSSNGAPFLSTFVAIVRLNLCGWQCSTPAVFPKLLIICSIPATVNLLYGFLVVTKRASLSSPLLFKYFF